MPTLKERELALETRFRARELALEEEIERGKLREQPYADEAMQEWLHKQYIIRQIATP